MIKAVIFDLDGTLAYTLPDLTEGMNKARACYGLPPITEQFLLTFINGTTDQFIRNAFPQGHSDEYYSKAKEIYLNEYGQCYLHNTKAYDGMAETLSKLYADGLPLAVFTNKDNDHANDIVNKLYGNKIFDEILGTGRFPGKPSPEGALYLAEKYGVKPCECAFVGDSDIDMKTAKNAGMVAVGATWGYREKEILIGAGADITADNPRDIYEIIKKIK